MENLTLPPQNSWPFEYETPPKFVPYWFEKVDILYWKHFMLANPNLSWYACAVYLIVIFSLQAFMKDRPPMKIKRILVGWNGFLALFSLLGFCRISQELIHNLLQPNGYYKTLCVREGRNLPADFWGLLFVLSKFLELGDTVFIVLRKQPLLALQWYHHGLVTVFAWKLYPWGEPILSYYSAINYGVHMFMYTYFAIRGLGIRVPEPLAMGITSLQILQMIVNTFNNLYTIYIIGSDTPCSRAPGSIQWSLGVYISLWVLFMKFFLDRYFSGKLNKKID